MMRRIASGRIMPFQGILREREQVLHHRLSGLAALASYERARTWDTSDVVDIVSVLAIISENQNVRSASRVYISWAYLSICIFDNTLRYTPNAMKKIKKTCYLHMSLICQLLIPCSALSLQKEACQGHLYKYQSSSCTDLSLPLLLPPQFNCVVDLLVEVSQ